jgi:hypothetical protein
LVSSQDEKINMKGYYPKKRRKVCANPGFLDETPIL